MTPKWMVCVSVNYFSIKSITSGALQTLPGPHLPCNDLLESVLALGIGVVSHDDHDHRHELVHQGQGAVLQLPSQDPF